MLGKKDFTKTYNWIAANLIDSAGYGVLNLYRLFFGGRMNEPCSKIGKILIIRTDGIGDTLLTTPLLRSLKSVYPEVKIDCLVRNKSKGVLKGNPYINKIIQSSSRIDDIRNAVMLRKINYDIIISPRPSGYFFNHFLAFLTRGRRRVGFAMKGGGFFLTDIIPWRGEKNILELLRDIAVVLGGDERYKKPEIFISNENDIYAKKLLAHKKYFENTPIIGLNPFAGHPFIWSVDRVVEVSERLVKRYDARIIFIGDKNSTTKIDKITNSISVPFVSFAGRTDLCQFAALIKRFHFLITVDSAPRHIANAVGVPVIVLRNGANSNTIWGRYTKNEHLIFHNVPCSPCGKKYCPEKERICMTGIGVDEVMDKAGEIIRDILHR